MIEKQITSEFDPIKEKDEQILWTEKPKLTPYMTNGSLTVLYLFAFGVACFCMNQFIIKSGSVMGNIFIWFGLIAPLQGLYLLFKKLLTHKNLLYAYTNKRVIIRSGVFGIDYKTIDYDKIADMEINVNPFEKLHKVGSIRFFTGEIKRTDDGNKKVYERWEAISDPYETFKKVSEAKTKYKQGK